MTAPSALANLGNTPSAPINPTQRTADDFHDFPRDQWGRPLITQLRPDGSVWMIDSREGPVPFQLAYTRASRAGSALQYEGALNSYHIRNAVIGVIGSEPLLYLARSIHEPGGAGRKEFDQQIIKPAQALAGANNAAAMGSALHSFAEKHDRGEPVPPLGPYQQTINAYVEVTKGWRWHGIEVRLVADGFRMAGKADRLGSPPGWMVAPDGTVIGPDDVVVLDLKTSSTSRYLGVQVAVQLAVYAHGQRYDLQTFQRTPTGARTDWGLIIHVPSGGNSGALYWVNLKRGAELVGLARDVLDAQGERGLVVPVATPVAGTPYYTTEQMARDAADLMVNGKVLRPTMPPADAAEGDPEPSTAPASPLAQAAGVYISEATCEIHGSHGGTVDCPECLEQWKTDPACGHQYGRPGVPFDEWRARQVQMHHEQHHAQGVALGAEVTGESELEVQARLARSRETIAGPASAALGTQLQAGHERDPQRRAELECMVIAQANPRGGLAALRERYAETWTEQHEAAAQLREWELGVIAAMDASDTRESLMVIWEEVTGWGRWTDEMTRVSKRRMREISEGDKS